MNKLFVGAVVLALALGMARAQTAPEAPPSVQSPVTTQSISVSPALPVQAFPTVLEPALAANRAYFALPGFGRVGYYQDPRGTSRPLVLVTSINAAASAYEMKPIYDSYAGARPVYVLEWPGFGSSDRLDVRYTPDLMAAALKTLIALVGQEVDVVALSLGSEFAARAALGEPRIRSLALISPTGLGTARDGSRAAEDAARAERLYGQLSNPAYAGALYGVIASGVSIRYFLSRSFVGPADTGLVEYSYLSTRPEGARNGPLQFIAGLPFTSGAYTTLYSRLTIPTLVLYDRDGFVNFARLPEFDALPNVSVVKITPSLGLPQFEQMPQVKAALEAFWAANGK